MVIDQSLLRRARIENLERLARAIGVVVPTKRRDGHYVVRLIEALATKIRQLAMLDELAKLGARSLPNVVDVLKREMAERARKKGRAA